MAPAISELWRYPVKSMAGESLREVQVTEQGLAGDRRHAFIDSAANRSGRTLTARQLPELLSYTARVRGESVEVRSPAGENLSVEASQVEIERLAGRPLQVRDGQEANYDDSHLLLLNLQSMRGLAAEHGAPLDGRRFRANAYLQDLPADEEYGWPGRRLRFGDAVIEAVKMCERCVMITLDPEGRSSEVGILRTLARTRMSLLGVYCRVLVPGMVRVGDSVDLL